MDVKQQIVNEITQSGQIAIDRYMEICNSHYYATRDPLGKDGDFTTSPEISQIFGEMIAVWAITAWEAIGRPSELAVVELGPGRGTLMVDFLRAIKVVPEFVPQIHMVETSPVLIEKQQSLLCHPERSEGSKQILRFAQNDEISIYWHTEIPDLNIPAIVIANEFFDALPFKQFVGDKERMVILQDGELAFNMVAEEGLVKEVSPIGDEIIKTKFSQFDTGVVIDYGYFEPAGVDTLQALQSHQYVNFLQNPGEVDLTAHVDFANIQQLLAKSCGKNCKMETQREFLLRHGGDVRAKILGAEEDFDRLINKAQMGELFKVICF